MPAPSLIPPPPSRIRIYFHTPVTPDDARPIPHGASTFSFSAAAPGEARKGKRKKLEDDDAELEERRVPPPPPGGQHHERDTTNESVMSVDAFDRASAAPSIAESASEADWLMAAIGEDEGSADADAEGDLHVSEVSLQNADGDGFDIGSGESSGVSGSFAGPAAADEIVHGKSCFWLLPSRAHGVDDGCTASSMSCPPYACAPVHVPPRLHAHPPC